MKRVVFLLEEYSMKVFLDNLLPRLFPTLEFLCVPHEGKSDLVKSIPRKLKAWQEPGVKFMIVHDQDGNDCIVLKQRLQQCAQDGGRPDTLVRIPCRELESWYLGSPNELAAAFECPAILETLGKARFRDPDAVAEPSRALTELIESFQKVGGARRMSHVVTRDNSSKSFQVFLSGVERMAAELTAGSVGN
jgi:hypothetical protein